jgi:type I restriction enzyme R subunit
MQSVKDIAIRSKNKLIKALKSGQNQIVVTIDIFNNLLKDNIIKGSADTEIPFIKDQKIAIMFDECHRSLFGSQFKNIKKYFTNAALLGFTGTPIFTDNDPDFENITPKLFPTQLHVYGMGQALADGIILPVDYENQDLFRVLDGQETSIQFDDNEKRQIWKTKKYYELLAEDVVKKYHEKSSGFFYTMLAVSSIDAANYIYKIFKGR